MKFKAIFSLLFLPPVASSANSVSIDAIYTGWYSSNDTKSVNGNYYTGYQPYGELRSYFLFDLSNVTGSIQSAKLHLYSDNGYITGNTDYFSLFDITNQNTNYLLNGVSSTTIFNDLGTGEILGQLTVKNGDTHYSGRYFDIDLNLGGLQAIQSNLGQIIGLGGTLNNILSTSWLFGNTSNLQPRQLEIIYTPNDKIDTGTTPEPSIIWLISTGIFGMIASRRRKIEF